MHPDRMSRIEEHLLLEQRVDSDDVLALMEEREMLIEALMLAQRMHVEALPKFNWGASCLDANAIDLLNRAPAAVTKALIEAEGP